MAAIVRVLLVEDEALVARGMAAILSRQRGVDVVGNVTSRAAALIALDEGAEVDVIVTDVMLQDRPDGLDLVSDVNRRPRHPPVLLLSSYGEPWMYEAALQAGALGYLLKGANLEELVSAIRNVAAGITVFPATALRERFATKLPSRREREIMRLVADGCGNLEIGARLGIKDKTVESHLTRLFARYEVLSRTELAFLAARQGWIGTSPWHRIVGRAEGRNEQADRGQ